MIEPRAKNRRRTPRYPTDQFVPAVLTGPQGNGPLGGHVVDVSLGGARVVAAPSLADSPSEGQVVTLVFARSDGNRDLDVDGARVRCTVVDVRETAGARVIRLEFAEELPDRLQHWLISVSRGKNPTWDDALPEFDPDVWAGWAAISPRGPGPG